MILGLKVTELMDFPTVGSLKVGYLLDMLLSRPHTGKKSIILNNGSLEELVTKVKGLTPGGSSEVGPAA